MADGKISKHVNNCLSVFGHLLLLDAPTNSYDTPNKEVVDSLREEEARFKVWVGNIGAHKAGRSSLDYRLRDASHIQERVIELITDLTGLIESARAIIAGEKIPWDKFDDGDSSSIDDATSEADSVEDEFPKTELDQIVMDAADVINCLLRLSVAIRNPAPHDRFAASVPAIDTDHYEPFDIQHVQGKFGQADQWLAARLGKAMSRRRQYFKYRERHHQKLAEGLALDHGVDYGLSSHVTRDGVSTIASSIPEEVKGAPFDRVPLSTVDEDALSDSGVSQTSFASSNAESEKLKVPPLPEEAHKGPFECPFCFRMITASSTISWRRHVFGDLRPYICLWEGCDDLGRNFARRHEWTAHELQNHWRRYVCPLGCNDLFFSPSQCKKHLDDVHPNSIPPAQVDPIVSLSVRPARPEDGIKCPLCQEALSSFKLYQRHVGRHQEQLALFALPPLDSTTEGDSEADSEADHFGQSDAGSSSEEYDETKAKVQKARVRAELDRLRSEYEELERRMYSDEEPKDDLQFNLPMREEERWLRQYLEETEEIQRHEEELENLRKRRDEIKGQGATEGLDRKEFNRFLTWSDRQVLDDLEQLRRFPARGWWKSAKEYVEKGRAKEAEAERAVKEYRRREEQRILEERKILEEMKILEKELYYQRRIEEANPEKKLDPKVEAMKRQLQQFKVEQQKKAEEEKKREEKLDPQKRIELAEVARKVAEYRRLEVQKILEEKIDYQTRIEEANPRKKSDAEVDAPTMYRPELMRNIPLLTEDEQKKYETDLCGLWNTYESSASDSEERAEAQVMIQYIGSILNDEVAKRKQASAQRQAQQGQHDAQKSLEEKDQRSPGPGSEAGGDDQAPNGGFQEALREELAISLDQSNRVSKSHLAGGSSAGEDPGQQQDVDDDGGGIGPGNGVAKLRARLSELLQDITAKEHPKVRAEIDQAVVEVQAELNALEAESLSSRSRNVVREGLIQKRNKLIKAQKLLGLVDPEPGQDPAPTPPPRALPRQTQKGRFYVQCCNCGTAVNTLLTGRCECLHSINNCCNPLN